MPAAIFTGYSIAPTKSIGGIKTVLLAPFNDVVSISQINGLITKVNFKNGSDFVGFQVQKNTSNYSITAKNGLNKYYEESINLVINRLTPAGSNLIQAYLKNTLLCVVQDRNGEGILLGRNVGLRFASGNIGSGMSAGDRNGYEFSLGSQALKVSHMAPAYFNEVTTKAGIFTMQFTTPFN